VNRTNVDTGPVEETSQPTGQPTSQPENIAEMEITGPVLTWLEISHPQQPVPIGENDRVLDSRFNEEYDVWEVLLVALPDETEEDEEEEE
jgi:hypothetical protein